MSKLETTIKVSNELKAWLKKLRSDDQSYNDYILELMSKQNVFDDETLTELIEEKQIEMLSV